MACSCNQATCQLVCHACGAAGRHRCGVCFAQCIPECIRNLDPRAWAELLPKAESWDGSGFSVAMQRLRRAPGFTPFTPGDELQHALEQGYHVEASTIELLCRANITELPYASPVHLLLNEFCDRNDRYLWQVNEAEREQKFAAEICSAVCEKTTQRVVQEAKEQAQRSEEDVTVTKQAQRSEDAREQAELQSSIGCMACRGAHRKHTCGKAQAKITVPGCPACIGRKRAHSFTDGCAKRKR